MSTKRCLFAGFRNWIDPFYAGASVEAPGGSGAGNLRDFSEMSQPVVFQGVEEARLDFFFGDDVRPVSHAGLFHHNLGPEVEVRAEFYRGIGRPSGIAYSTDWARWSAAPIDSEDLLNYGDFMWGGTLAAETLASYPKDWLHPILGDDGKPDDIYCGSGHIYLRGLDPNDDTRAAYLDLSQLYQPSKGMTRTPRFGSRRVGKGARFGRSGSRRGGHEQLRPQTWKIQFRHLPLDEWLDRFYAHDIAFGDTRPLVWIPEPDKPETWPAMAGLYALKRALEIAHERNTVGGVRSANLELEQWYAPPWSPF